jgi:hypothetical protein
MIPGNRGAVRMTAKRIAQLSNSKGVDPSRIAGNASESRSTSKLQLQRTKARCSCSAGIAGNRKAVRPTMVPIAGNQKRVVTIHLGLPAIPLWS